MSEFIDGFWMVARLLAAMCVVGLLALVLGSIVSGIVKAIRKERGKGGK